MNKLEFVNQEIVELEAQVLELTNKLNKMKNLKSHMQIMYAELNYSPEEGRFIKK